VFQAIIAIIRLLIDPELRATLSSVRESTKSAGGSWAKQIGRSRAKFGVAEKYRVWVFADRLRQDLQKADVSEKARYFDLKQCSRN
jgi:hypothetical protein